MSGNLWMFSDMLDDEDAKMMQHEFVTYYAVSYTHLDVYKRQLIVRAREEKTC